jgi:hypothetical protein
MFIVVFLLGRPGSGKSTGERLIRMFARDYGWLYHSINDYEHLQRMFLREEAEKTTLDKRDFIRRELDGCIGFDVQNFEVLRTVLTEMRKEVEDIKETSPYDKKTLCTVEFARATYQDDLELFGSTLLAGAQFLYFDVDVRTCIDRNHKRTDHLISDEIMKTYYRHDDWARKMYNLQDSQNKSEIKNTGTLDDFARKAKEWFEVRLEHRIPAFVASNERG